VELALEVVQLAGDLVGELGVPFPERAQLHQVVSMFFQPLPGADLLAELRSLPGVAAGLPGVLPDPGLGEELL
jgi:hypothetical protein